MKRKKKKTPTKITIADYVKAVKKADREIELSQSSGWKRTTTIHKNKKIYNRNTEKKDYSDE